jgi:hypothetical protein
MVFASGWEQGALAGTQLDQFRYARSIQGASDREGIWRVPLDAPIYNATRPDFADLRVISSDGIEVPFVLKLEAGTQEAAAISPSIFNAEYQPGRSTSVVLDFGGKVMKNSLRIVTSGEDFKRKVEVEASEDRTHWSVLRDDAFVLQAREGEGGRPIRKDEVSLPDGDQRYLRIRVFNDASDPAKVEIDSVTASRIRKTPPALEPVSVAIVSSREDDKERFTELVLDTGARGRALESLSFDFNDPNFHRSVKVEGRDGESEAVEIPLEDGGVRQIPRPLPWEYLTSGALSRVTTAGSVQSEEKLAMGERGFRFLRVRIYNGDDSPLKLRQVEAEGVVRSVFFAAGAGKSYRLYYGNSRAVQPRYDLIHFLPRLEEGGLVTASLGGEEENSGFKTAHAASTGKQTRRVLLWGALALVAAVLAWLIRSARTSRRIEA